MKTVLCFGDSNTWGYNPKDATRYTKQERWTGILQSLLGQSYNVIEEGLRSRTTLLEDVNRAGRNGLKYLLPC